MKVFAPFDERRVSLAARALDFDVSLMTDVYFTRTLQILKAKGINPWVRGQMFLRNPGKQKCKLAGVHDVIACFGVFTDFFKNGGRIWSVPEGFEYSDTETVMVIEGWAQDFVELETVYLGLLSAATTQANFDVGYLDLAAVKQRVKEMKKYLSLSMDPYRRLVFFGARHYYPHAVRSLTEACWEGGATDCSTKFDASYHRHNPVGTIPHFLQNVLCYSAGLDGAVTASVKLFDEVIDPRVPRVCLIDWRNREQDDAERVIEALGDKLTGFRLDTAGENICQGALYAGHGEPAEAWKKRGRYLPHYADPIGKHWWGHGVTVSAAMALIDQCGDRVKALPFLTSGFSNPRKVKAFVDAEFLLGRPLFSGIGFGEVTNEPGCYAKLDIIGVGPDPHSVRRIHKAGRPPKRTSHLVPAAGTFRSANEQPVFGDDVGFLEPTG